MKEKIITFRADKETIRALEAIKNKSDYDATYGQIIRKLIIREWINITKSNKTDSSLNKSLTNT